MKARIIIGILLALVLLLGFRCGCFSYTTDDVRGFQMDPASNDRWARGNRGETWGYSWCTPRSRGYSEKTAVPLFLKRRTFGDPFTYAFSVSGWFDSAVSLHGELLVNDTLRIGGNDTVVQGTPCVGEPNRRSVRTEEKELGVPFDSIRSLRGVVSCRIVKADSTIIVSDTTCFAAERRLSTSNDFLSAVFGLFMF